MPTIVNCPGCGKEGKVPDVALGRTIKCPECGKRFTPREMHSPPGNVPSPPAVRAKMVSPIRGHGGLLSNVALGAFAVLLSIFCFLAGRWSAPSASDVPLGQGGGAGAVSPPSDKNNAPASPDPVPVEDVVAGRPLGVKSKKAPESPALDATSFGETLTRGDVEITIASAEITTIAKREGYLLAKFPTGPVLIVRYQIKNTSKNKRFFIRSYVPRLIDDVGNHYNYIEEVPHDLPEFREYYHDSDDAVDPGENAKNSEIFECPLDSSKVLVMELAGEMIADSPHGYSSGSKPPYRFAIPIAKIDR